MQLEGAGLLMFSQDLERAIFGAETDEELSAPDDDGEPVSAGGFSHPLMPGLLQMSRRSVRDERPSWGMRSRQKTRGMNMYKNGTRPRARLGSSGEGGAMLEEKAGRGGRRSARGSASSSWRT